MNKIKKQKQKPVRMCNTVRGNLPKTVNTGEIPCGCITLQATRELGTGANPFKSGKLILVKVVI
ncbi:MAG: hypothetical protein WCI04_06300 [archaeon]